MHTDRHHVRFVKDDTADDRKAHPKGPFPPLLSTDRSTLNNSLQASDSRALYEKILQTPAAIAVSFSSVGRVSELSAVVKEQKPLRATTPSTTKPPQPSAKDVRRAFDAAEIGDVGVLAACQRMGVDGSVRDGFGWTLLMVAASTGQAAAVRWMLSSPGFGPQVEAIDSAGRTALSISTMRGTSDVSLLLTQHIQAEVAAAAAIAAAAAATTADAAAAAAAATAAISVTAFKAVEAKKMDDLALAQTNATLRTVVGDRQGVRSDSALEGDLSATAATWFCSVCQGTQAGSRQQHVHSISHQFSCGHEVQRHPFLLTSGNKGYQLMVKGGWDDSSGLGSRAEGRLQPVKTVLKRDRVGFGMSDSATTRAKRKAQGRVTHFQPMDADAVKSTARQPRQRQTAVQAAQANRDKERHLRELLS